MSDILEEVLSNHNEHIELYQNQFCVSQDHYLTSHNIFFSLEIYVPCVLADNNMKCSDQFSEKTIRARCLEM